MYKKKKKIPQTFGRHVQLFSLHFLKRFPLRSFSVYRPVRRSVSVLSFSVKCISLSAHQRLERYFSAGRERDSHISQIQKAKIERTNTQDKRQLTVGQLQTQFPKMILYLAQNPHCIIEPFLARLLLLCLLLFTSPSLPGRGSFACLAAYSTSSQQPYRTSPENTRTQRNPEPRSTFPFEPAAREKYSIDHDLKNVSDITSLRVWGDVVSVSV